MVASIRPSAAPATATDNAATIIARPIHQPTFEAMKLATSQAASATASSAIVAAEEALPLSCRLYDPDPLHLWNRLHCHLQVRVGPNGMLYGLDELDTLHWDETRHLLDSPSHDQAVALLDEFLATADEDLVADPIKRAVMQRDLWAIFEWLEGVKRSGFMVGELYDAARVEALQARLARAMRRVALSRAQIEALPDNYVLAVKSGTFAPDIGAGSPPPPFLPADLLEPRGPWLLLGRRERPVAREHIESAIGGRSLWLVLIRVPGARADTEAFVTALAHPGSHAHPPDLVPGTEVALMRRMLLVDDQGKVVPSPITESIQVRHYAGQSAASQAFAEMNMERGGLFAGQAGGLRDVGPTGETFTDLYSHGSDPFEFESDVLEPSEFRGDVVLESCSGCHSSRGALSIQSFSREIVFGAGAPATLRLGNTVADEAALAVAWKMGQEDWESLAARWP